jgi:hypothetical protein
VSLPVPVFDHPSGPLGVWPRGVPEIFLVLKVLQLKLHLFQVNEAWKLFHIVSCLSPNCKWLPIDVSLLSLSDEKGKIRQELMVFLIKIARNDRNFSLSDPTINQLHEFNHWSYLGLHQQGVADGVGSMHNWGIDPKPFADELMSGCSGDLIGYMISYCMMIM